MTIAELQPYLAAISAIFSVACLAFLLNLVKAVRDNAQDILAVKNERLQAMQENQQRTETWAEREKAELKTQLDTAKAEIDALLKSQGLDLSDLSAGKQLTETVDSVRATAEALVKEMEDKITRLASMAAPVEVRRDRDYDLSLAMGAMASGNFADAARHFDAYAETGAPDWEASFARGVAHANQRAGHDADLAALRAYNDAIALAPADLDDRRRARMFGYRGAMLKRLGRFAESEADLKIALGLVADGYERADAQYNLAGVYALRGNREAMLEMLGQLKNSKRHLKAARYHARDYFKQYASDADFIRATAD